MATVVVASGGLFSATDLGNAMARLWNVDGLLLRMGHFVDIHGQRYECPMTLNPITNPGIVEDGSVYQLGFITRWLDSHNSSPLTNLPLLHRHVLKLASLRDVFEVFLAACRTRQNAARAQLERSMEPAAHGTLRERRRVLKNLESYNTDLSSELEAWTQHCDRMRAAADRFRADLQTLAAVRLQSLARAFLVRTCIAKKAQLVHASRYYLCRVFTGYYRKEALILLQRSGRAFLARRHLLHESKVQLKMSQQLLKAMKIKKANNANLVKALLDRTADVNHVCQDSGNFPLFTASAIGDSEVVRVLCEARADKQKTMQDGITPLIAASFKGHFEVVKTLLNPGASKDGHLEVVASKDQAKNTGETPLFLASLNGHLEVVQALLAAGASKDQAKNDGATPLFIASQKGHLEVVEALLAAGASKDQAKNNGATPLYVASQNGHLEVVQALLAAGASKDQAMDNGATPLFIASQKGHLEVVQALLAAGASKDQAMNDGETLLFIASQNGHLEVVEALLAAGASKPSSVVNAISPSRHLDAMSS